MFLVGLAASASRPFSLGAERRGRDRRVFHEPTGHRVHLAFFGLRGVVVADQVQDAVREQEPNFLEETALSAQRLARSRVNRDHDVAEPARAFAAGLVVERKGQHVGRLVLVAVDPVQLLDFSVIREQHAELTAAELERRQHGVGEAAYLPGSESWGTRRAARDGSGHARAYTPAQKFSLIAQPKRLARDAFQGPGGELRFNGSWRVRLVLLGST